MNLKVRLLVMIWASAQIITGCGSGESPASGSDNQARYQQEIVLRLQDYENLLRKGDSVGLSEMYTTDAEIIPSTRGRQNILKALGSMIRDSITGKFESSEIWGNDQLIAEEGKGVWFDKHNQVTGRGKYLLLWKKENGEWKIFKDTWFPEKQQ